MVNKWSVEDVGRMLGLSRARVSARLNGRCKFSVPELEILAEKAGKELKITFEDETGGTENR